MTGFYPATGNVGNRVGLARTAVIASMNTNEIYVALRKRFAAPAYGFLTEVGDATGGRHSRWCDGLAMSLWPSRGLEVIGIEVKASRSDWTKELKDPSKAEAICKFCDRWYLAVGDKAIVKDGELPPTWGLLVPKGDSLVIHVEAPKLEPQPVTRHFMAAIFRRSSEQSADETALKEARDIGYREGQRYGDEQNKQVQKAHKESMEKMAEKVREFQEASGLQIVGGWRGGREVGRVVNDVLHLRYQTPRQQVENLQREVQQMADRLKSLAECGNECLVSQG